MLNYIVAKIAERIHPPTTEATARDMYDASADDLATDIASRLDRSVLVQLRSLFAAFKF